MIAFANAEEEELLHWEFKSINIFVLDEKECEQLIEEFHNVSKHQIY